MPKGEPTSHTRANDKYQKKVGLIAKSFKLKKELTERFAETCRRVGVGQAATISRLMEQFIKDNTFTP